MDALVPCSPALETGMTRQWQFWGFHLGKWRWIACSNEWQGILHDFLKDFESSGKKIHSHKSPEEVEYIVDFSNPEQIWQRNLTQHREPKIVRLVEYREYVPVEPDIPEAVKKHLPAEGYECLECFIDYHDKKWWYFKDKQGQAWCVFEDGQKHAYFDPEA